MNTPLWQDLLSHLALKGAALLTATFFLGLLLCRLSAARRYVLWIGAAIAMTALPLAIPFLPAWRVLPAAAATLPFELPEEEVVMPPPSQSIEAAAALPPPKSPVVSSQVSSAPIAPSPAPAPLSAPAFSWPDLLATLPMIWLSLSLLLLARIGLSAWRLRRLEKRCAVLPAVAFGDLAAELGLRRLPVFLLGSRDAVPMVWGIFRSRLLLPAGYETWPPNQLRAVLLHEFAHLKRRDPAALFIAQVMQALHAFNPLAWFTLQRLRADQERACDDTVLRHGIRPSDYAQHLLDLSRHTRLAPGLSLCALAMARPAPVESRVAAILDRKRPREPANRSWSLALATLILLITAPLAMLHALEGPKLRGRILDRNGVVLAESQTAKARVYPLKGLAGHLTGYVIQPADRRDTAHPMVGGHALEKQADADLAAGKDVTLALDARIQQIAYRAFVDSGSARGAAVVLDPRNGAILAMLSLPVFDPNKFVPHISKETWESLVKDQDTPLLDRTLRVYTPGAAFIPVIALAGMAGGKTDAEFECTGSVMYGKASFKCWIDSRNENHGLLNMRQALIQNCNCYWYQLGHAIGTDQIKQTAAHLGFGSRHNILPGENQGQIGDSEGLPKQLLGAQNSMSQLASISIGQGLTLTTPMQLAVMAAALANGGKVPQPSLLKSASSPLWKTDLTTVGVTTEQIDTLRKALWEKVNGGQGTAKRAHSGQYEIAGTTGTTQNWRKVNNQSLPDNYGWFIGFAPYDKPTLAFAIFVQSVKSGGTDCAPIAKQIVEQTLALPADGSGRVDPVEVPVKTASIQSLEELREAARAWTEKAGPLQPVKTPAKTPNQRRPILNPDDEKRWRWLQKVGDLQELPEDAQDLRSSLEGEAFPRTSTVTFLVPENAAMAWLTECPGYWRYQRGLQRLPPLSTLRSSVTAGIAPPPESVTSLASALEYREGPAKPGRPPILASTEEVATFHCSSFRLTHCAVAIQRAASPLVQVTIKYTANPSRIHIAD